MADKHIPVHEQDKELSRQGGIDSHVHFWKYDRKRDGWITNDMKILQQDYLPQQLSLNLKRNGVDGCVAVQADQSELETRFLVELAKTHALIRGVVGWVDLQAPDVEERLGDLSVNPVIKGYRHIVQGEPDDFLLRPDFHRGLRALKSFGYSYDLLIYHHQLTPAVKFVSLFADQKIVLDHCAKPDIRRGQIDEWKRLVREIALQPNLYCKLSGLFTEAAWKTWSPAEFYPYLDTVFEAFGTGRLMFGSDWPVILVSGMYVQWKSLLEKYMESYSEEDRNKVFALNAMQFYDLTP
jgi:L-fuconolactonase